LEGEDLDEAAVKRAIELTDEKYCSVIATLRATPPISSIYEIKTPVS
jgi:putative redox protein